MYDWANSAFATTIMAAMFPPFYRMVTASRPGQRTRPRTGATPPRPPCFYRDLLNPMLGAIPDHTGGKKRYVTFFAALGIVVTGLFAFLGDDTYILGTILFIVAKVGFAGANIFYESLLPHIAKNDDIDQVSTRGYAMGYVGGGILLVINLLWYMLPEGFWMPGADFALRASFFSVAVWWAIFTIPLLAMCPSRRRRHWKRA